MLKTGLINFFKSLKYYLTPLGIIAIAMAFAFSVALPGIMQAPNDLFNGVSKIFSAQADWQAGWDSLTNKVTSLDWKNNLPQSLMEVFNTNWLRNTLKDAVLAMYSAEGELDSEIYNLIFKCINDILFNIVIGLGILILGFILGYVLLKFQIKGSLVKGKKLGRTIIISVIKIILDLAVMGLGIWLTTIWVWNVFIFILVFIVVNGLGSLIEAYYAVGYQKIKFKEIVNFKNLMTLYLTTILIYAIGIGFVLGVAFLVNNFVGVFLGVPLLEITIVVVGINSEAYVRKVVEEKEGVALLMATAMMINGDEIKEEEPQEGNPTIEEQVEQKAEEIKEQMEEQTEEKPEENKEEIEEKPAETPQNEEKPVKNEVKKEESPVEETPQLDKIEEETTSS